jgi:hypothetical protein
MPLISMDCLVSIFAHQAGVQRRARQTGVRLFLSITAMLFILNGCADRQPQQRQTMAAAAREQFQAEHAACRARFSESDKDACLSGKVPQRGR